MLKKDAEAKDAYLKAVDRARDRVRQSPKDPVSHKALGLYCARVGQKECALEEGNLAETMQPEDTEILFTNAVIFCILGQDDAAFDRLEHAVRLGLARVQIENDPDLSRLRGDSRYARLLHLAG
jgi:Flp pilus assembly protein TadD